MKYCANCGEELVDEAMFCGECGTKINMLHPSDIRGTQRQASQPKKVTRRPTPAYSKSTINVKGRHSQQSKTVAKIGIATLIGIIVITSLSYGFSFINPKSTIQKIEYYQYNDPTVDSDTIIPLSILTRSASVEIKYNLTNMEEIVSIQADYDLSGRFGEAADVEQIFDILFTYENNEAYFELEFQDSDNSFTDRTSLLVLLRTDLQYDLEFEIYSGDLILNVPENCQIMGLDISLNSGNAYVSMSTKSNVWEAVTIKSLAGDIEILASDVFFNQSITLIVTEGTISTDFSFCNFGGDFDFQMSAGQMLLVQTDATYVTEHQWALKGTSGDIQLDLEQRISPACDSLIAMELLSGNIAINYLGNASVEVAELTLAPTTEEFPK